MFTPSSEVTSASEPIRTASANAAPVTPKASTPAAQIAATR
jgi:hypothetical protein